MPSFAHQLPMRGPRIPSRPQNMFLVVRGLCIRGPQGSEFAERDFHKHKPCLGQSGVTRERGNS